MLKYLRIRIFKLLLAPFSHITRKRRMQLFVKLVAPTSGMKILDLGGQPDIWDSVKPVLNITCLNLPGVAKISHRTHHNITYIEGDACSMPYINRGDFDIVFSNSVLEHVGGAEKQLEFVNEVQRLSDTYWIQTPCKYFPIEAHCGMPFWWFYPNWLKSYFIDRWSRKLPAWTEMVSSTTVISKEELESFLPKSKVITEWLIFPKSLIAYSSRSSLT